MIAILLLCSGYAEKADCSVAHALRVWKVPGVYTSARECQDKALDYAAKYVPQGTAVRIICAYPSNPGVPHANLVS